MAKNGRPDRSRVTLAAALVRGLASRTPFVAAKYELAATRRRIDELAGRFDLVHIDMLPLMTQLKNVDAGIPVVLKDNLNWKGAPTRNGSRILEDYASPYDATVVRRLLDAGAVPVAKANMDEFAMGSSGEHSCGSILSVAAGYAPFALGTDTGGSVRLPAGFCNVTAFRPTYGVLSRFGVTAMASSLDQVGPVAANARDLAAGLSVLAGKDPLDATSVDPFQSVQTL